MVPKGPIETWPKAEQDAYLGRCTGRTHAFVHDWLRMTERQRRSLRPHLPYLLGDGGDDDAFDTQERDDPTAHEDTPALAIARDLYARIVGGGESIDPVLRDASTMYLHLRNLYLRALEESRPPRHERDQGEMSAYLAKRALVERVEARLARRSARAETGEWLRLLGEANGQFERALGARAFAHEPEAVPVGPVATRGPDRASRQRRERAASPPPTSSLARRETRKRGRLAKDVERVVRLLRRSPGLSGNQVFERLRIGRVQLAAALSEAVTKGRLEQRGTPDGTRYYATPEVDRISALEKGGRR